MTAPAWWRRLFGGPPKDHSDLGEGVDRVERKARDLEREIRHVEAIIASERAALEAERRRAAT